MPAYGLRSHYTPSSPSRTPRAVLEARVQGMEARLESLRGAIRAVQERSSALAHDEAVLDTQERLLKASRALPGSVSSQDPIYRVQELDVQHYARLRAIARRRQQDLEGPMRSYQADLQRIERELNVARTELGRTRP